MGVIHTYNLPQMDFVEVLHSPESPIKSQIGRCLTNQVYTRLGVNPHKLDQLGWYIGLFPTPMYLFQHHN